MHISRLRAGEPKPGTFVRRWVLVQPVAVDEGMVGGHDGVHVAIRADAGVEPAHLVHDMQD